MKILVLNPNTSESVTEKIAGVARRFARPDTELLFVTAPYGVPYIATRTEALIGGQVALEVIAEREAEVDAVVLAAFGDPGLGALREMFSIPIVGLAEASMLAACTLGRTFSIVSFSTNLQAWYRECVEWHRMENRLASIRMLDRPFDDIGSVQADFEDMLVELANRAIREDGADVIITAGAPLAGLAARVRSRIGVPVVEGVAAAVGMAELLGTQALRPPRSGAFRRPPAKPSTGLSPALADLIGKGGDS
ncbi:MAG: aspartate/glutamate racemase family protein [Rhodobacteraceae bacterium]|nr:aspartate/glutamate racemase family protein [Paracoccaceae bacterium]